MSETMADFEKEINASFRKLNEGEVLVGGKDVRSYDLETLRNDVAVVLQKNVLFSVLTLASPL